MDGFNIKIEEAYAYNFFEQPLDNLLYFQYKKQQSFPEK